MKQPETTAISTQSLETTVKITTHQVTNTTATRVTETTAKGTTTGVPETTSHTTIVPGTTPAGASPPPSGRGSFKNL